MYIHYARITTPRATKLVQLLFCSGDRGKFNITKQKNEFHITKYDWEYFCIPVVSMLKQIPSSQRNYDNENKVWTIIDTKWDGLTEIFKALGFRFISYNNLYVDCVDKDWDGHKATVVPDAADFFHDNSADEARHAIIPGESREEIEAKLEELLETSIKIDNLPLYLIKEYEVTLKKMYRKAAMKYHPDLNGGDATKMTNLNYYWQLYQQELQKMKAI